MSIYKLCLKIILRNGPALLVYLVIFLVMTYIIVGSGAGGSAQGFVQTRIPMLIRANESSPILDGLKRELERTANLVKLPSDDASALDALFFGRVTYLLDVPEGFSAAFRQGELKILNRQSRPDERASVYLDMVIKHYFRLAGLYRRNLPRLDDEQLVESVERSLNKNALVVFHEKKQTNRALPYTQTYFNIMSYSLFNLLILGICSLTLVLRQRDIRLRNSCGSVSLRRLNGQIFTAGLSYSLLCWLLMSALCLLLLGNSLPWMTRVLFLFNGIVFTVWGAAAAFAIGQLTESREALSGIATVVTLGTSFLGGAFVPQEFLGAGLLKFSQFLPTYWYVRANRQIAEMSAFRMADFGPFLNSMGMQLLFGLAFLSLALVVARSKQQER